MNVTVDANILFAALLKDSATRKLWFNPELALFAPVFMLVEFNKYQSDLKGKYGGTAGDFESLCNKILSQVKFITDEELKPFLPAAATLSSDSKDWLYFACALKEDTIIWSQDKEMKKQHRIQVKTTTELMHEVGSL